MIKPCKIDLTKGAQKDLTKVPSYIKEKLLLWVDSVERSGQRSIRLNKAYRAIYTENEQKEIVIISIIEVNKHDY